MPGLTDLLGSVLTDDTIAGLANQINADKKSTATALSTGIPAIVEGLAQNASSESGRKDLFNAIQNDHDGSVLDDIGGLLSAFGGGSGGPGGSGSGSGGGLGSLLGAAAGMLGSLSGGGSAKPSPRALNGDGILKHALGGDRGSVEKAMASASGLDMSQVAKLLPLAAPLIMAALGKLTRQGGLDPAGLAGMLTGEKSQLGDLVGNLLKGFMR